jgi:molecular chaperone GrpE (heat shock protein)
MLRSIIALLVFAGFIFAAEDKKPVLKEPPQLTTEQKLEVRDLQLQLVSLQNQQLQLQRRLDTIQAQLQEKVKEVTPEGYALGSNLNLIKVPASAPE